MRKRLEFDESRERMCERKPTTALPRRLEDNKMFLAAVNDARWPPGILRIWDRPIRPQSGRAARTAVIDRLDPSPDLDPSRITSVEAK